MLSYQHPPALLLNQCFANGCEVQPRALCTELAC
jgi:hypothetical protein